MSDHKYERDIDREILPHEIKKRLIVLEENGFSMPEAHIYDEPVRYLKMNLEWFKIFSGVLSWMEHPAFWKEAQDWDFDAIQQVLLFEEGIEAMATVEEICEGVICALEKSASRFLAGVAGNIEGGVTINPDGTIEVGGDAGLPEDDPSTEIDETESSRYGAVLEIAAKLELVLDKADAAFGVPSGGVTPVKSLEDATAEMIIYFPSDVALMTAAMSDYYDYRLAGTGQLNFDRGTVFPLYLYCNGYSINALGRFIIDLSGYPIAKQQIILGLWAALLDEFYSHYFEIGKEKPSNAYLEAACVPIPYQEFENVPFASARATTPLKASHRMKFRISGVSTDTDGDIQDAFWFVNASTGVRTRTNPTFTHSAGSNLPTDFQIPYNPAHVYEYTIDLGNLNAAMVITMNKHANMSAGASNPNFEIQITDLGLAVSQ